MVPNLAPQTRVAFSSIFWKTGSNSPGEALMTWRTSDVAVCCSSDSASSRERACTSSNSRAFSMAITAWLEGYPIQFLFELRCKAVVRLGLKIARLVWTSDLSDIRFAKSDGRLYQRVKHCLQIER